MARATFLHLTKANFFKQISALTIFALGFSLLGVIAAPQASALNNFAALNIAVDASGRAGATIKVQVQTKLSAGSTSSADQIAVGLVATKTTSSNYNGYSMYSTNHSGTSFATTLVPSGVSGNIATYNMSLTAPSSAGTYALSYCISSSTTPMTYSELIGASSLWSPSNTVDLNCQWKWVQVGGAPTRAVSSHLNVTANPTTGSGSGEANAQVAFFDSSGFRTRLTSSELFTLTSTSANLSAGYGVNYASGTGTIPSTSKALVFNASSGDADAVYRYKISDAIGRTSVIKGQFETSFGSGNFAAPAVQVIFSTNSVIRDGFTENVFTSNNQVAFASGTDGKLYYWGALSSTAGIGGLSWVAVNVNKPKKIDFLPIAGQVNSTTAKQIISNSNFLSNDGVLYKGFNTYNTSLKAMNEQVLEPDFYPSLNGVEIAYSTASLQYLLDSQGRVWKRNLSNYDSVADYSVLDLSGFGNPIISKIAETSGTPSAAFLLTTAGEVLSLGSNADGLLGQNISLSSSTVGRVSIPDSSSVTQIHAGYNFAYAIASNGNVWTWGNNGNGRLGKDPTLIPYAISPILAILPVGARPIKWGISQNSLAFVAEDSKTVYAAYSTLWQQRTYSVSMANMSGGFSAWSDPSYTYSYVAIQSDGRIYSEGSMIGNCSNGYGFIRSVGQFGPVSTDDTVQYSGVILQTDSGTSTVGNTFSMKVGETSTIQVVQPRTSCYAVDELVYNWDLDGSGSYATPATSSLSQTGYQAFNAALNFSTAGRKYVKLRLSTPDGLNLYINFIVGVEPAVAPTIDFGDTATAMISGSLTSSLGVGTDGKLYTWGSNNQGQLSSPTTTYTFRSLPMAVALPGNAKVRNIFSYYYSYSYQANYVVDTSGKVWGAGSNYAISGSYGVIDTFTSLSNLASYNIVDMQAAYMRGFALTKSGQILTWQLGTTSANSIPTQIVSLAGVSIKNFTAQHDGGSGVRIDAVDTDGNLWLVPINGSGVVGDATKVAAISGVRQLSFNGTQATIVATDGSVWFSSNGSNPFASITVPAGVTPVDAMYLRTDYISGMYLLDSNKKIWTASANQSGSLVTMSTWTAYAAQANGQAGSGDQPIFQHRGSSFISFASGNLLYAGYSGENSAGRCGLGTQSQYGNRVFSSGQFGAANITDQIYSEGTIAIASQNAASFVNGQFFSANSGDAVVIRMVNPRSSCFNGSSQLTAVADTAGDGNFNTIVPLSNDGGGNYSFTLSGTAPTSGRKNISVRIATPLGTSSTISLGLGVFSTETITAIVPRTNPINTSDAAAFAVASDGYAYGWSTPTDVTNDYYGSTMAFMNMITSNPPRNSGSPTKLQLPGGVKVREAVPFSKCCSRSYGRYIFGVLAVDEFGRTWTWASESALNVANGYTSQTTPTTATQIPALVGENVIRLSVSTDGYRALALTSKGIVYQWGFDDEGMLSRTPTRVPSLAGLKILDIYSTYQGSFALTDAGDVYAFNGYTGWTGTGATTNWGYIQGATKVVLPETVTAIMPLASNDLVSVKTASGKVYVWGQYYNRATYSNFPLWTPVRMDLPNSRTPGQVGTIYYDGYASNVITATDGTWWDMAANAQNQIVLYQRANVSSAVNTTVTKFASGAGQAMVLQNGSIYTTSGQIAGTCGPISTYTRVMSDGQFGPQYKADQVYIYVNGNEITRPNTPTSVSVTGWSACDGGAGIVLTADYVGNNIFGDTKTATVSLDGSRATSTFTFTKTANGPVYMHFKATTAAGLSGTETFFTKVVPAPLPGRQIGISINAGDRYTNSSNVSLSLVWPDGTTKIYVSNDGGFAPGTVSDYDLQYTVPWVLPPQAVIPLPSIVYARFDNDPNTYYFDDIILDAIVPVLTYASAR